MAGERTPANEREGARAGDTRDSGISAGTMPDVAFGAGRTGCRPRGETFLSSSSSPLIVRSEATTFCLAQAKTPPGILGGFLLKPAGRTPAEPSQDGRAREQRTLHLPCQAGSPKGRGAASRLARQMSGAADGWSFTKEECFDFPEARRATGEKRPPASACLAGGTPSLL